MPTNNLTFNPNTEGTQNANWMSKHGAILLDKTGSDIDSTNPLPVTSVSHTSSDVEGLGPITVGTTAVELTFTGTTESISILSDPATNTGYIYVGLSNVTNLGANALQKLDIGETLIIDYDDTTNALFVVSDTASQVVIVGALK